MHKGKKTSRVFIRLFLTHLLVLMLPLLFIGTVAMSTIRAVVQEQAVSDHQSALRHVSERVGQELEKLNDIAFKASSDQIFSPHILSNFAASALNVMSTLRTFRISNSFVENIYLLSEYSNYVCSPSTTYTVERFIQQKLQTKRSEETLFAQLSQVKAGTPCEHSELCSPRIGQTKYLISTLPCYGRQFYAYLIFEVSLTELSNLLTQLSAITHDPYLLMDGHAVLAQSAGLHAEVSQALSADNSIEEAENMRSCEVDGKTIAYSQAAVPFSHWHCLSVLSQQQQASKVITVSTGLFWVFLLLSAVGVLGTYLATNATYRPILALSNAAKQLRLTGENAAQEPNELVYLQRVINETIQQLDCLASDAMNTPAARHSYLINHLINSSLLDAAHLTPLFAKMGVEIHPYYAFVAIFQVDTEFGAPERVQAPCETLAAYLMRPDAPLKGICASIYARNIVAVITCREQSEAAIALHLTYLYEELCALFTLSISLGVGGVRRDFKQLALSFNEATIALEYRFAVPDAKMIRFDQLKAACADNEEYPRPLIAQLCDATLAGDVASALGIVDALMCYIRTNANLVSLARLLYYDAIQSVLLTIDAPGINMEACIGVTSYLAHLPDETIDSLKERLDEFCVRACEQTALLCHRRLSDRAAAYMAREYADPAFSVGSMAAYLEVSAPTLSRCFKAEQGQTLNDFIRDLRMNKAKALLRDTPLLIEAITKSLGYYDTSGFIKKFKALYGVTPGDYRRQSRKEESC
ncbi:MAG: AraC family transcriptional regulator [Clostridia bacterium]